MFKDYKALYTQEKKQSELLQIKLENIENSVLQFTKTIALLQDSIKEKGCAEKTNHDGYKMTHFPNDPSFYDYCVLFQAYLDGCDFFYFTKEVCEKINKEYDVHYTYNSETGFGIFNRFEISKLLAENNIQKQIHNSPYNNFCRRCCKCCCGCYK